MSETQIDVQLDKGEAARLAEAGDVEGLIALIRSRPEEERRPLTQQLQKELMQRAKTAEDLDLYVSVIRPLIHKGVGDAGPVGQSEDGDKIRDFYNALSYNFAADLADCWPGDELAREARHFEAGLAAAEDCIRWRNELAKPPRSFSIAYWAKGAHLLALGHYSGAVKSFAHSLEFARRDAQQQGKSSDLGAGTTFDVPLNTGYLGLAQQLDGDAGGAELYRDAIEAFKQLAGGQDMELAEDARFGIDQLETVRRKYVDKQNG